MRIERVGIDGFGRAAGAELELSPGVTVVRGMNGTGKSTLNAFVRAMLFGLPSGAYPAVRGGRRGGHLQLATDDGRRIRLERHGERGGRGELRLLDDHGVALPGDPHETLAHLLGGADRELFEAIFAFGIDELADASRLEGGEVSARIYGASLGASGSILEIERALHAEADGLFRPRGQRQAINATLAELAALEAELAARDVPREYAAQQARAASLRAGLEALDRDTADRAREREAADRLVRAWPAWRDLEAAEADLAVLGPAPDVAGLLPEEARLAGAISAAEARQQESLAEVERRRATVAALPEPRRDLLDAAPAIAPLASSAAAREVEDRALATDERRLDGLARDVSTALADLGPGWDEGRLRAAGSFIAERDRLLARARDLLDSPVRAAAEARATASNAAREAAVAEETAHEAGVALAALPRDDRWNADSLRDAVDAADRALMAWTTTRAERETALARTAAAEAEAAARRGRSRVQAAALAAGTVVLASAAAGAMAAVAGPMAAVLVGVVLLVVGGAAARAAWAGAGVPWRGGPQGEPGARGEPDARGATDAAGDADPSSRNDPGRGRGDGRPQDDDGTDPWGAAERVRAARAALDAALAALGLPSDSGAVPLALREQVGELARQERDRAALERQHDAAVTQALLRRRAADDAATRLADAEGRVTAARAEWERVLASTGLPPQDPEAVARMLERAESARITLRAHDDLAVAVATGIERRGAWERGVRAVLEPLGCTGTDLHALVRAAVADLQEATRLDAERRAASRALEAAEREAEGARGALAAAREAYRAFLARHGLADRADLEARHTRAARRAALEADRDRNVATLAAIAGDAEATLTLRQRLGAAASGVGGAAGPSVAAGAALAAAASDAGPDAVAARRASLDAELESLRQRRHQLATQLGAAEQEIRRIESETDTSELRQRRENTLAALCELADRYLVARLAAELIAAARARFERLHRPAVIAAAERHFVDWTGGEFAGLVVPFGERVRGALRADDGSLVRPAELSRGTREQLYLAFRFGLIEHYASQAEPLPIVMDEVLVNFDPARAGRVARTIRALGQRHQVLYLTCHDTVPLEPDREIVLGSDLAPRIVRDSVSPGGPPR